MDLLTDVLRTMHLHGGLHVRCEFSAPWGMEMALAPVAMFHIILCGRCWLQVEGESDPISLHSGDVVLVAAGRRHTLVDTLQTKAVPADQIVRGQKLDGFGPLVFGGGGVPSAFLCGYFEFQSYFRHSLVSSLPPVVHIRDTNDGELTSLRNVVRMMEQETACAQPGTGVVVDRLAEILFVQIMRAYLLRAVDLRGVLAALADRQLAAALSHIHRKPEQAWTIASLAHEAGMSRSVFAMRFARAVGQTPMHYLTQSRMQRAQEFLLDTPLSVADIAERVGYRSETAFRKAFKKLVGIGPGALRATNS